MRSKILLTFAALTLVAGSAWAGECTQDTQTCLNYMAAKSGSEAWIGVDAEAAEGKGYKLKSVSYDSPASKAGLKAGDMIVAVGGFSLAEKSEELSKFWKEEMRPGNTIAYTFVRDGKEKTTKITLVAMPEAEYAKKVGKHMIAHAEMKTADSHEGHNH